MAVEFRHRVLVVLVLVRRHRLTPRNRVARTASNSNRMVAVVLVVVV